MQALERGRETRAESFGGGWEQSTGAQGLLQSPAPLFPHTDFTLANNREADSVRGGSVMGEGGWKIMIQHTEHRLTEGDHNKQFCTPTGPLSPPVLRPC